ncbi:MAG: hypothetical protein JWM99_1858 [Verrucomicrobiales bacterium]|jgi:hypothetical protein|nr:hypothetical protein [Verrucomicrobiales bacterium]
MSIFYDHAIRVSANGEPIDWLLQLPPTANALRRRFAAAVRLDAKGLPGQRQLLFTGSGN